MSFIDTISTTLGSISLAEIIKSFSPLFVAIDILGAIPIILQIRGRGQQYSPWRVALYSGIVLLVFLFAGEAVLSKLGVDIASFGAAGGIILMAMAWEMTFGTEIFKEEGSSSNATIIPLVFPLFAGAAAFTTLLNLQSQGIDNINLLISVMLNMVFVYLGLRYVEPIEKLLGKQGSYILRKVFGVILIAIATKYLVSGVMGIVSTVNNQSNNKKDKLSVSSVELIHNLPMTNHYSYYYSNTTQQKDRSALTSQRHQQTLENLRNIARSL